MGDDPARADDRRAGLAQGRRRGDRVRGAAVRAARRGGPGPDPTPLGVDVERAWILLPDGGPVARRPGRRAPSCSRRWSRSCPSTRGCSASWRPHAERMLAEGVPDMRPAVMPNRFEQAMEAASGQVSERGAESERATLRRVAELRDAVAAWSERLAEAPGPGEHRPQRPPPVERPRRARDGGFERAALLRLGRQRRRPPIREHAAAAGVRRARPARVERRPQAGAARSRRLPRGLLRPGSHDELVDTLELACRLGKVARALTWERAIRAAGPGAVDERWTSARLRDAGLAARRLLPRLSYGATKVSGSGPHPLAGVELGDARRSRPR